jgi:diguanylate cyclase
MTSNYRRDFRYSEVSESRRPCLGVRRNSSPSNEAVPSDSLPIQLRRTIRVTIVTPEDEDFRVLSELLHQSNDLKYAIKWSPDYESACHGIDSDDQDIFLIEEDLEPYSGLDLIREATSQDCSAPCILICREASIQLEDAAMLAGAVDLLELSKLHASALHRTIRFSVERKKSSTHLANLAQRDCLTGLSNRLMFEDRLQHAIKRAGRGNHQVGLLYIDLDGFKTVNDTYGHEIGDKLLKIVAQRMIDNVREVDMVARLGGDEFTVILESLANHEDGAIVAQRLINALSKPISIDRLDFTVSASIGIAVFPKDATDEHKLLLSADKAMYLAKGQGGNSFIFASEDKNVAVANRFALEARLESALINGELYLTYHPQIDLERKRVAGVMGSLCWRNTNRGDIASQELLPLLEESNQADHVCLWMIDQACKQVKIWNDLGMNKLAVEVGLFRRLFLCDTLAEHILDILNRNGISAQYLVLGLVEDMIKVERRAQKQIQALQSIGIRLSLRGIDTGYASISYLDRYSFDFVRIHKDIVNKSPKDRRYASTIKAIIAIAKEYGVNVIAENNENELFLSVLEKAGCRFVQSPIHLVPDAIKGMEPIREKLLEQETLSEEALSKLVR